MGHRLRAAGREDIAAVAAIYGHHVLHGLASFEEESPGEAEMTRRFDAVHAAGYPWLVAELESGEVGGYAYASGYRARPAYRFSVENSVYVAPDAIGLGLGRLLLSALIDECTTRGYRQMIAIIGDSENHASIGLHRALGFEDSGTLRAVGFKHERWVDSVIMQLSLGDSDTTLPQAD